MRQFTVRTRPNILVVDDDEIIPLSLRHHGERFGFELEFTHAGDMAEAVTCVNEQCFDAAILDVCLPGLTGISLGELIRQHDSQIPLAYLTDLDTDRVKAQAAAQRAMFLFKQRFIGTDEGVRALLEIIDGLARLNPCLPGGVRVDDAGFARQLSATPLEIPAELQALLNYGKMAMKRAA